MWRAIAVSLRVALVLALAYLGYVFLARQGGRRAAPSDDAGSRGDPSLPAPYTGSSLKILQFYSPEGAIVEDQSTNICYGVVNAKSVRLDPPVDHVYPALNRCFSVTPEHDTKYVLTAVGADGSTATSSFTLKVLPDTANLPRITQFEVVRQTVELGKHYYYISFRFENARMVSIDPPVFSTMEDSAPFGQFEVAPDVTTTYTLTVTGKKGRKAQKQLTVDVPKG